MKEPGRNDPCWCGSGIKYKLCHLNRNEKSPFPLDVIIKKFESSFNKEYCLHPDSDKCNGNIVKAHTIQRNGGLSQIAERGHVYSYPIHFSDRFKQEGPPEPILVGVKKASTFTGFCQYHDSNVFAPIENGPIKINEKSAFLLAYRAICREVFAKKGVLEMIPILKQTDMGTTKDRQIEIQKHFAVEEYSNTLGLRNLNYHKSKFDEGLLGSSYDNINFFAIKIKQVPEIMCSGAAPPEYDFSGNLIQDLFCDKILDHMTFSLIGNEEGGLIFFSWIGEQPFCKKLIQSISSLDTLKLPNAIVRYAFEFFENIFFSPSWWKNSNTIKKEMIKKRMGSFSKYQMRDPNCLQPDYINYVDWEIESIETNLKL